MRAIVQSTAFKKDYKRIKKRGLDTDKLKEIITLLVNDQPLPDRCKVHTLTGNYAGVWDCHIAPDWLLLYQLEDGELVLRRTGTHSDLFR